MGPEYARSEGVSNGRPPCPRCSRRFGEGLDAEMIAARGRKDGGELLFATNPATLSATFTTAPGARDTMRPSQRPKASSTMQRDGRTASMQPLRAKKRRSLRSCCPMITTTLAAAVLAIFFYRFL